MAKNKNVTYRDWLQSGIQRMSVFHYLILVAFAVQTVVMDAWRVIVPEVIFKRWVVTAGLLVVTGIVWYLAHNKNNDIATYKRLIFGLITADIVFAAYNVYLERGMASRAVALFAVPIITGAVLLSRSAVFAVATFSTAAYILATVSYFTLHFNEGYKTELYAEVGFYACMFFVLAGLLTVLIRFGGSTNDS